MATGKYQKWITEEGLMKIQAMCEQGVTDEELIGAMGIVSSTFYDWQKKYPEIAEAITCGRGGACELIKNALFQRARGGFKRVKKPVKRRVRRYDPETGKCILDEEIVEEKDELIYVPPDTRAIMFFLENRDPDNWGRSREEDPTRQNLEDVIKEAMENEKAMAGEIE